MLGPLANNGGPTLTHLPGPLSPVIDAGGAINPGGTDQRGLSRFVNGALDIGSVEVALPDPTPIAFSPDNGATGILPDALLSWTPGSPALSYEVFLDDGAGGPLISIGTTTATSVAPPATLTFSTTYSWRVDATDASGTFTGPVQTFTTRPPFDPTPIAFVPADLATDVTPYTSLSWTPGDPATSYEVFLDDGAGGPLVSIGTTTDSSVSPSALLASNTTYTWRIDATDASGTFTGPVLTFTTREPLVVDTVSMRTTGSRSAGFRFGTRSPRLIPTVPRRSPSTPLSPDWPPSSPMGSSRSTVPSTSTPPLCRMGSRSTPTAQSRNTACSRFSQATTRLSSTRSPSLGEMPEADLAGESATATVF